MQRSSLFILCVFVLSHGLVVAAEQPPLGREALSPPYPVSPQLDNGLEFAFGFTRCDVKVAYV